MSKVSVFLLFFIVGFMTINARPQIIKNGQLRRYEEIYVNTSPKMMKIILFFQQFTLHLEDYSPQVTRKIFALLAINVALIGLSLKCVPFLMNYNVV